MGANGGGVVRAGPATLPDIYRYWHDRFDRDPGNQWIRAIFKSLFRKS